MKEKDFVHKSMIYTEVKPIHWKIFAFEVFGTMIFTQGVTAAGNTGAPGINNFIVALAYFAGMFFTAPHSGGHLNPSISIAFFISGDI